MLQVLCAKGKILSLFMFFCFIFFIFIIVIIIIILGGHMESLCGKLQP